MKPGRLSLILVCIALQLSCGGKDMSSKAPARPRGGKSGRFFVCIMDVSKSMLFNDTERYAEQGAKLKDIALASRLATTGRRAGPSLFEVLSPIGRENVVARLRAAAKGVSADGA